MQTVSALVFQRWHWRQILTGRIFSGAEWVFLLIAIPFQLAYLSVNPQVNTIHGPERMLHVAHMAYALRGDPDHIPLSFIRYATTLSGSDLRDKFGDQCKKWRQELHQNSICRRRWGMALPGATPRERVAAIPLEDKVRVPFVPAGNTFQHFYLGYMPFVSGVWLATLAGAKPLTAEIAGRITNGAILIALGFFCIRIWPVLRWSIALILLLPTLFFLRAQPSPDGLTIELCFLFIGLLVRLWQRPRRLTLKGQSGFMALGAAVSIIKCAYVTIAPLILLLPAACFASRRRKWIFCGLFLAVSALSVLTWGQVAMKHIYGLSLNSHFSIERASSADALTAAKVAHVLYSPRDFFAGMVRSLIHSNFWGLRGNQIVMSLQCKAYADELMLQWIPAVTLLFLTASGLFYHSSAAPVSCNSKHRLLFFGLVIATYTVFYVLGYVHDKGIGYAQFRRTHRLLSGRYLIPIFPLLLLMLPPIRIKQRWPILFGGAAAVVWWIFCIAWLLYFIHTSPMAVFHQP